MNSCPTGIVAELLLAGCDDRDRRCCARRCCARRIKAARFPAKMAHYDPYLGRRNWREGEPLCLIGDSGTGKACLVIALDTVAAQTGFRVRYTLATKLVNELVEASGEPRLAKTIARYDRVGLLCIDELCYIELDQRGAEMLFQVLTEREEPPAFPSHPMDGQSNHRPRLCAARAGVWQ